MIPSEISDVHIAQAVAEIRKRKVPARREAVHYDLLVDGDAFPPKYVISVAARFATSRELPPIEFNAVEAKDFLIARGYTIVDRRGSGSELLPIPKAQLEVVLQLFADCIKTAASIGDSRWGVTYWEGQYLRLNVGWTELLTATARELRLIVSGPDLERVRLPSNAQVTFGRGAKGFYPSIPGSALIEVPLSPIRSLISATVILMPALRSAILLAGRRKGSAGVRAGHNQWAVDQIGLAVGAELPSPGYISERARPPRDQEEAFSLMEGALRQVVVSRHERNRVARRKCVQHYGATCTVCTFDFERAFGAIGRGFIHVHHIHPMAGRVKEYRVHPISDLRPICPNCHAMVHRVDPPYGIDELRAIIAGNRGGSGIT